MVTVTGPTQLAFALLLKFYTRRGRFPRGRSELPDEAVAYVPRLKITPGLRLVTRSLPAVAYCVTTAPGI